MPCNCECAEMGTNMVEMWGATFPCPCDCHKCEKGKHSPVKVQRGDKPELLMCEVCGARLKKKKRKKKKEADEIT